MPTVELVDTPDLNNYYTKAESDGLFAVIAHTHLKADITDFAHTHPISDISDFPDQTGNDGKFLTTNAGVLSWDTPAGGGGGTPGGVNRSIQYNDSGAFGGSDSFAWDNGNGRAVIGGYSTFSTFTGLPSGRRLIAFNDASGYGRAAFIGKPVLDTDFAGASVEFGIVRSDLAYKRLYTITGDTFNASDLTSRAFTIIDNQNAGAVVLSINPDGDIAGLRNFTTANNAVSYTTPQFRIAGFATGIAIDANTNIHLVSAGTGILSAIVSGSIPTFGMPGGAVFGWTATTSNQGLDTALGRNAAGVIEVNNGTLGTFRDLKLRTLTATGQVTGSDIICLSGGVFFGLGETILKSNTGNKIHFQVDNIATDVAAFTTAGVFTLGSAGDVGLARSAAGLLEVNSGVVGTLRDLTARTFLVANKTGLVSIGSYGTISETGGGLAYITGNSVKADTVDNQIVKTSADNGHFMRMRYDTGISFHSVLTGAIGTTFADTAGQVMRVYGSAVRFGASGADDVGLSYSASGILEVNNGTVGTFRDLKLREIFATGAVRSNSPTSGIGYSTGAGGTVAQNANKSTGVTLNKVCGQITMNAAALAAGAIVSFVLTNSAIAVGDNVVLVHSATGTVGGYLLNAQPGAGTCTINVRNTTAGSLSEAIVITFTVIKSVTA